MKKFKDYVKYITAMRNSLDVDIAIAIRENEKGFDLPCLDSIRRAVSTKRREFNLYPDYVDKKEFQNYIDEMIEKHPDSSTIALTKKVHLKFPEYASNTIRVYVNHKLNWSEHHTVNRGHKRAS